MVFGSPLQNPKKYKSEEVKFSNDIIKYWTNFVRTGYVTKVFNGGLLNLYSYFLSTYYMKISVTLVDFQSLKREKKFLVLLLFIWSIIEHWFVIICRDKEKNTNSGKGWDSNAEDCARLQPHSFSGLRFLVFKCKRYYQCFGSGKKYYGSGSGSCLKSFYIASLRCIFNLLK